MDQNTEKAFDEIEKALRPEVSKEQLGMVIEHLMEAIESMIEIPEKEEEDSESENSAESEDSPIEIQGTNPSPIGDPDKNPVNWPVSKSEDKEDYESDNEEEDKWDNMQKACWTGYTQRGMKEKNGRMVPNCVPVEKINKSIWGGTFIK